MPRSQSRRFALATFALATVLFLATLELALRLVPRAIPLEVLEQFEPRLRSKLASSLKFPTRKDTVLVPRTDGGPADILWVYRPEAEVTWTVDEPGVVKTVRMDGAGFCNPAPAPAQADLVAVGDSLTFCTAVSADSTWVSRIAPMLRTSTYNLALPNRGLYEYLQLLERFGLAKSPRVVVVTIYEGNDFRDASIYRSARQGRGPRDVCPFGADAACHVVAGVRDSAIGRHSLAINFLAASAWRMAIKSSKREIDFRYHARLADGTILELNSRNGDRDEVTFAKALAEGRITPDLFDEGLERLRAMGREHRFQPVLVYLPSAYTAYASVARFEDPSIERLMRQYSERLRAYFATRSRELGLPYLDTTPALSAAAARATAADPVFFPANVHLTAGGHAVVAEAIAGFLREQGLLGEVATGAGDEARLQAAVAARSRAPGDQGR
ncbi:MAG TPA: hypothetical protein VEC57_18110 [Candidatus Limnocylindrales bacterium]|nr:hypothetical protein [Candidatus Limnocylindrales bacterium]